MIVLMCVAAIVGLYQIRALVIYGITALCTAVFSAAASSYYAFGLGYNQYSRGGIVYMVCCVYGVLCVLCVCHVCVVNKLCEMCAWCVVGVYVLFCVCVSMCV